MPSHSLELETPVCYERMDLKLVWPRRLYTKCWFAQWKRGGEKKAGLAARSHIQP